MTLSDVAIRLSYSPVHRRSATYWSIPMHPKRIHQLPRWKAMWKTISRLRIGPTVFQKWWTSTVGKIVTFPIWWESHKSHVPNHQPDNLSLKCWDDDIPNWIDFLKKHPNHQPARVSRTVLDHASNIVMVELRYEYFQYFILANICAYCFPILTQAIARILAVKKERTL